MEHYKRIAYPTQQSRERIIVSDEAYASMLCKNRAYPIPQTRFDLQFVYLVFRLSRPTSDSIDLTFVTFCTGFRTNGTVATVNKISNAQNTRQENVEMPAHADAPVEPRRNE